MTAVPTTVQDYIGSLDASRRQIATQMHDTIHAAAPGITGTIRYKMPCFVLDGHYLVYFGAWKNHIGLYPIPRLDPALEADVRPYRTAKDTVRFRYADPVPWDLVQRLIAELVRRAQRPDRE
jgi:uncharacterized protein YdhG (YjbR/CyaY superfamily)